MNRADPYLLALRLQARNRVSNWRAQPAQTVFHGAAAAGLLAVLVWAALPGLHTLLRSELPLAALGVGAAFALVGLLGLSRGDLRRWQVQAQSGWLACTPWPEAQRRRTRVLCLVLRTGARVLVLGLLPALAILLHAGPTAHRLGLAWLLVSALALLLSGLSAYFGPRRALRRGAGRTQAPPAVPPGTHGLVLLRFGWSPLPLQRLRWRVCLPFLLIPVGTQGFVLIALLGGLLAASLSSAFYTHYRLSVFAASAWLRVPALSARQLGSVLGRSLLVRCAVAYLLAGLLAWRAGAPLIVVTGVVLLASAWMLLAALLVLIYRRRPQGLAPALMGHALLCVLSVQVWALFILILLPLLLLRAWRRVNHSEAA